MGCLGILLGPLSGFGLSGGFGFVQLVLFGIASAIAPQLFWLWWLGCGVWTAALFSDRRQESELEAERSRAEELEQRVEDLEDRLGDHGDE